MDIVVIRGGGDIATAVAHKLHNCGFRVLLLEIEKPQVIRLKVSFALAVYEGSAKVEGITAKHIHEAEEAYECWQTRSIPVMVDPECSVVSSIKPDILIDCILAKKNLGLKKDCAPLTIALGPGFEAGRDAHVVIETKRGHNLGRIIQSGFAEENTGIPGVINGFSCERVLRAPGYGIIRNVKSIGDMVNEGDLIANIEGDLPQVYGSNFVKATISGVLRGLIYNGSYVCENMKIGDIDPRGDESYCSTISDKGRTIAGAVVEAIMQWKYRRDELYE